MSRPVQFAALAVAALFACSCALVDRDVVLDYSAPAVAPKDDRPMAALGTVEIRKVADRRGDMARIGEVRNAFGMHTADVRTGSSGAAWVEQALRVELERAGFTVVGAGSGATFRVEAELMSVHCTAYFSYSGDVNLVLRASQSGREIISRAFDGHGSAGMNWTATEASFAETVDLALQDAIREFAGELVNFAAVAS